MSWYFIDGAGTTQGPVAKSALVAKWNKKELDANSYIWNGTTVVSWSLVKDTFLYAELNKPKPAAPRAAPAPKRAKPAGGGMANLLESIKAGKKLKKATKADEGSSNKPKPKAKMSLQEQLAMRLKKPKGGSNNRGGSKPAVKKAAPKPVANNNSAPKKTWKEKQAEKKMGNTSMKKATTSNSSSPAANKSKLKRMIDECNEDWVLKAVEKLLQ